MKNKLPLGDEEDKSKDVRKKQDPLLTPVLPSWCRQQGSPLPKAKVSAGHHGSAEANEPGLKLKACCCHIPQGPAGGARQGCGVMLVTAHTGFNALISGTGSPSP